MSRNSSTEDFTIYSFFSLPIIHTILVLDYYGIVVEALGHFLLVLVLGILVWTSCRLKLRRTAHHALYSTVGLFFCAGEAELLMCRQEGALVRCALHIILGTLALWTGFLGILSKSLSKRRENQKFDKAHHEAHLVSKHGYCGVLGFILLGGCLITGLVHLILEYLVALNLTHRILGTCGFLCLASSQWFSYNTAFARRNWSRQWIHVLKVTTLGATLCVAGFEVYGLAKDIVQVLRFDVGRTDLINFFVN